MNQTGLMWELAESFGALLVFAEHRCEPKSHGAFCGKGAARNCVGVGSGVNSTGWRHEDSLFEALHVVYICVLFVSFIFHVIIHVNLLVYLFIL